MIVLVCGGRDYTDAACIDATFELFTKQNHIDLLVHGDCRGADRLAGKWAELHGYHVAKIPALWNFYNKAAGSARNNAMLLLPINYCIAFPGEDGTKDMISKCEANNITVWRPYG